MYDYIIIGQGIAGTVLSHELLKAGKKVLVVDNGFTTSSSMMAAGMWNPILFRKLKKSWKADELLPALARTYSEIEELIGQKFMFDREIVRLFPSNDAANDFSLAESDEVYSKYLVDMPQPEVDAIAKDECGYGTVREGGYAELKVLLPAWRDYLESQEAFKQAEFDEADLVISDSGVEWKGLKASKIIYATGYKTTESKYWKHLPLHRTHGDVLTAQVPDLELNRVFNNGQFLLPMEDGPFKIGATFDWKKMEPEPTEEAKNQLLEKLYSGLKAKPELTIINHEAGIRPTVQDRKPLVGIHPEYKSLAIFNGMGTKGVMLAPFFATQLTQHFLHGNPLDEAVNVSRFAAKYEALNEGLG